MKSLKANYNFSRLLLLTVAVLALLIFLWWCWSRRSRAQGKTPTTTTTTSTRSVSESAELQELKDPWQLTAAVRKMEGYYLPKEVGSHTGKKRLFQTNRGDMVLREVNEQGFPLPMPSA